MIAYSHYIKFIPKIDNEKKSDSAFIDTVTIKERSEVAMDSKLTDVLTFFNNQGRDLTLYTDREFSRTQKGQLWAFEVKDVVTFYWYGGTMVLEYTKHERFTAKLLKYWSLHIVLPLFFIIEEYYDFLHAGAVEVDEKPILFIAQSCGGKSTMTDYFMKQGHTMVSDDKVGFFEKNGDYFCVPSHPYHRPYRNMEDLGYVVENMMKSPKPIHAIYLLQKNDPDASIDIAALSGVEKFLALRYNSEINLFFQKPLRFEKLMKLAKRVPVYSVKVPWSLERLDEVYESICQHSKEVQ